MKSKSRCFFSEPNFGKDCEMEYRNLMRNNKKSNDHFQKTDIRKKSVAFPIVQDKDDEENLNLNLKANCIKHLEKRSIFPSKTDWKSSDLLKKR